MSQTNLTCNGDVCTDRSIKTCITATYYDTTFLTNQTQNTMCHYQDIEPLDTYKCFNTQLTSEIIVRDINFLFFLAQREVKLSLITTGTVDLLTREFYLYQPTQKFSFRLAPNQTTTSGNDNSCITYIHCLYANVFNPNSSTTQNLFRSKLEYQS